MTRVSNAEKKIDSRSVGNVSDIVATPHKWVNRFAHYVCIINDIHILQIIVK